MSIEMYTMGSSNSSTAEISTQESARVGDDQAHPSEIVETDLPSSSCLTNEAAASSITGMDGKIFAAAAKGDIITLSNRPGTLHEISTPTKNTVLHIYVAHASYSSCYTNSSRYGDPCLVSDMLIDKLPMAAGLWDKRPTTLNESQKQRSRDIVTRLLEMSRHQLLLQANDNGDIALHIAARYGLDCIVEVLISNAKALHDDLEEHPVSPVGAWKMLRTSNKEGNTPLHEATRFKHIDVVKILIKEDPEYSYPPNSAGKTPIYLAAERGYQGLVSELLKSRTDPDYQGPSGKTALHAAVISDSQGITRELLEKEKTLATSVDDEQGWTPLHFAAFMGNKQIVSQLLDYDRSTAYIADKDDKKTALHIAAAEGHKGVLKELINRCPDCCELVDGRQRNILHYAIANRKFKIMKVVQNHPWMSNILLNGKDDEGNTPLHKLVNISLQTITESLIQDGKAPTQFIRDARVDKMVLNKEKMNVFDILSDDINNDNPLPEVEKDDRLNALKDYGARPSRPIKDGARINDSNKVGKGTELGKEAIIGVLMVVAILIATVTFAAGFTVPGGYQSEKGPDQGLAILTRKAAFKTFVVTNTIAMILSSSTVLAYLIISLRLAFRKISGLPYLENQAKSIFYAMLAMVIAFITGTYAVLGSSSTFAVVVCAVGLGVFVGNSIWNCTGT